MLINIWCTHFHSLIDYLVLIWSIERPELLLINIYFQIQIDLLETSLRLRITILDAHKLS